MSNQYNDQWLRQVFKAIHDALDALDMTQVTIPEQFKQRDGELGTTAVTLETTRYCCARLQSITIGTMRDDNGNLRSITTVSLPLPDSSLPIFGLDLVALGANVGLAAVDFFPTDQEFWSTQIEALLDTTTSLAGPLPLQRKLPPNLLRCFSSKALISSVTPDKQKQIADSVCHAIREYTSLIERAVTSNSHPGTQSTCIEWCKLMQSNKREQKALAKIFGEDWASDYLEQLLFNYSSDARS